MKTLPDERIDRNRTTRIIAKIAASMGLAEGKLPRSIEGRPRAFTHPSGCIPHGSLGVVDVAGSLSSVFESSHPWFGDQISDVAPEEDIF